jgi:hypothetical protein
MIRQILTLIVQELEAYIESEDQGGTAPFVVEGNIGLTATLGGTAQYMNDKVVVGMVNLMEEASMKNTPPIRVGLMQNELESPPVYLNPYFLFTAHYPYDGNDVAVGITQYNRGLTRLSQVVAFFQGKNQFSVQNSPHADLLTEPQIQDVCVNVELVSLTFEQINYLWGSLGGKQLPFVMYKAYVVPVSRGTILGRGGAIQEIQSNTLHQLPK